MEKTGGNITQITETRGGRIMIENLDEIMGEIAQYTRMAEEITATLDGLKGLLKKQMEQSGIDTITGAEHKATYKAVTSSRIDTTLLKREHPEIAARYTKQVKAKRFIFA